MADKWIRDMRVLTDDGVVLVPIEVGSEDASTIGRHWNAIQVYTRRGDDEGLDALQGVTVGGLQLVTDPDIVKRWAKQGELDIDDPYEPLGGDS